MPVDNPSAARISHPASDFDPNMGGDKVLIECDNIEDMNEVFRNYDDEWRIVSAGIESDVCWAYLQKDRYLESIISSNEEHREDHG